MPSKKNFHKNHINPLLTKLGWPVAPSKKDLLTIQQGPGNEVNNPHRLFSIAISSQ